MRSGRIPLRRILLEWLATRGFRSLITHTRHLDEIKFQVGSIHARLVRGQEFNKIQEAEFRVFSQFGEDGIIQYLINEVDISDETFVEIGIGDYSECNTRFLLEHDNWSGVVFDQAPGATKFLSDSGLAWRHNIEAHQAEVTPENVNRLLKESGVTGDIGLLSLDVDGVDYWILENLSVISPRIIVAEYNSVFQQAPVTVPNKPGFDRLREHYSGVYFGVSIAALNHLLASRGYKLVGSNSSGHNAFFVREDAIGRVRPVSPEEAYTRSQFRDTRDESGALVYLDYHSHGLSMISELPVVDVTTNEIGHVSDFVPKRPA